MKNKKIKIFGYVLIAQFIAALILICTYSLPIKAQGIINLFGISLITAVVGLMMVFLGRHKNIDDMSFEERCHFLAKELKSGKRKWTKYNVNCPEYTIRPLTERERQELWCSYSSISDIAASWAAGSDSDCCRNSDEVKEIFRILSLSSIRRLEPKTLYCRSNGTHYYKDAAGFHYQVKRDIEEFWGICADGPEKLDPNEEVTVEIKNFTPVGNLQT